MTHKKKKAASKGKTTQKRSRIHKPSPSTDTQADLAEESQLQLPSKLTRLLVKSYWETLSISQRTELLMLDLEMLREWALALTEEMQQDPSLTLHKPTLRNHGHLLVGLLEDGLVRLAGKPAGTGWKIWRWPGDDHEFLDQASFRLHVKSHYIDDELCQVLGQAGSSSVADALRDRMVKLLEQARASEDPYVDRIITILAAFKKEHRYLYHMVMNPISSVVCQALPEAKRRTTMQALHYSGFEKLPLDLLMCMYEWLALALEMLCKTRGAMLLKVDSLALDHGTQPSGERDLDKFCLDPQSSTQLQIDPIWFDYLQVPVQNGFNNFYEDKADLAPNTKNLMLEWTYGRVTSPSDTCRIWAQASLGTWMPTVELVHTQLMDALRDMAAWQSMLDDGRQYLHDMLESRLSNTEMGTKYDLSPRPDREKNMHPCELPDHVVVALLKREALLARVKLHVAQIQGLESQERLITMQTKQHQDMVQLSDRAQNMLNTATALEETESLLKADWLNEGTVQDVKVDTHGHITAMLRIRMMCKQLIRTLQFMAHTFGLVSYSRPMAEEPAESSTGPCCNTADCTALEQGDVMGLERRRAQADRLRHSAVRLRHTADRLRHSAVKLKQAFHTEVRDQLVDNKEDHRLYQQLQKQLLEIEKRQQEGRAVLPFLEAYLLNVACDDPGVIIGPHLVLPLLQQRLSDTALEYHNQLLYRGQQEITRQKESAALLAGQQLLAEEELEKMRLAAKVARKQKAKAKKQQPTEQQPQQDIIQAEADLDSLADSDCLKAPTAIIETAAPESADPSTVDDDDWSVRNAPGLSAKQGWKAALGVDMVNRTTAVSGSRQGNDSTPLDSVMAASAQLTPRPQPQAGPSVTPEVHISLLDSKGDQTMMDLFLCPITKVLMKDPVIAADGHTYEKAAMQSWLELHQTSPVTGATLAHRKLIPNVIIRGVILQHTA